MDKAYLLANAAKPSGRQIKWQETEFYAMISYGLPVFTGKQYGDGFTPPAVFWPEEMDTDSWCDIVKKEEGADPASVVYEAIEQTRDELDRARNENKESRESVRRITEEVGELGKLAESDRKIYEQIRKQ